MVACNRQHCSVLLVGSMFNSRLGEWLHGRLGELVAQTKLNMTEHGHHVDG